VTGDGPAVASADATIRVLFVSTSNAARSILAEALLRKVGGDRFVAASAGISPTHVDPLTIDALTRAGFDHGWAVAEPIERYVGEPFDYVITLCDDARLACPVFPGADQSIHWGYRDPSAAPGDEAARRAAYDRVFTDLAERIRQFVVIAERQPVVAGA
jgi:arsenate reductase (thioredoxin)